MTKIMGFIIISTFLVIIFTLISLVTDMLSMNYYPFLTSQIISRTFGASHLISGGVLSLVGIFYFLFGFLFIKNPLMDEEILTKLECISCRNLIPKKETHCPYCGYIYPENEKFISSNHIEFAGSE